MDQEKKRNKIRSHRLLDTKKSQCDAPVLELAQSSSYNAGTPALQSIFRLVSNMR